jgi:hypothetical protein
MVVTTYTVKKILAGSGFLSAGRVVQQHLGIDPNIFGFEKK